METYNIPRISSMVLLWNLVIFSLLIINNFADGDQSSTCGSNIDAEFCKVEDHCSRNLPLIYSDDIPGKPKDLQVNINFSKTVSNKLQSVNVDWSPPENVQYLKGIQIQLSKLTRQGVINKTECIYFNISKTVNMDKWQFNYTWPEDLLLFYYIKIQNLPTSLLSRDNYIDTYVKLPGFPLSLSTPSKWTPFVEVRNNSDMKRIDVYFSLAPKEYKFKIYNIQLMQYVTTVGLPKFQNSTQYITNTGDPKGHATFEHVCPGSYVLWLEPKDDYRDINCKCLCRKHLHRCGCSNSGCATTTTHKIVIHGTSGVCTPEPVTPRPTTLTYSQSPFKMVLLLTIAAVALALILGGLFVGLVGQLKLLVVNSRHRGTGAAQTPSTQSDFHPPQPLDSIDDDESIATHYSNSRHQGTGAAQTPSTQYAGQQNSAFTPSSGRRGYAILNEAADEDSDNSPLDVQGRTMPNRSRGANDGARSSSSNVWTPVETDENRQAMEQDYDSCHSSDLEFNHVSQMQYF